MNRSAAEIGADDSFLELGGGSIIATRFISAARAEGVQLTVSDVFDSPELSRMAESVILVENYGELDDELMPFDLLLSSTDLELLELEVQRSCIDSSDKSDSTRVII